MRTHVHQLASYDHCLDVNSTKLTVNIGMHNAHIVKKTKSAHMLLWLLAASVHAY